MSNYIEGHSVFALMIKLDYEDPQLWAIYSNAKACCDNGEKICQAFLDKGIDAEYYCESYDVKGE